MVLLLTLSEWNEAGRGSWLVVIVSHEKAKDQGNCQPQDEQD